MLQTKALTTLKKATNFERNFTAAEQPPFPEKTGACPLRGYPDKSDSDSWRPNAKPGGEGGDARWRSKTARQAAAVPKQTNIAIFQENQAVRPQRMVVDSRLTITRYHGFVFEQNQQILPDD
jgi:predicted RNA-binding protein with PUA-like domain